MLSRTGRTWPSRVVEGVENGAATLGSRRALQSHTHLSLYPLLFRPRDLRAGALTDTSVGMLSARMRVCVCTCSCDRPANTSSLWFGAAPWAQLLTVLAHPWGCDTPSTQAASS